MTDTFYGGTNDGDIPVWDAATSSWKSQAPASGGGAMELVETIVLTGDDDQVLFEDLDGDEDGTYYIFARWVNKENSSGTYLINPNGISANLSASLAWWGASGGAQNNSDWQFHYSAALNELLVATIWIVAPTGIHRSMFSFAHRSGGYGVESFGTWNDDSTNITSLELNTALASGFGDGGVFSLFKLIG